MLSAAASPPARTIGGWLGLPSWQLNLPEVRCCRSTLACPRGELLHCTQRGWRLPLQLCCRKLFRSRNPRRSRITLLWLASPLQGWAEDEHGRPLTRTSLALTDVLCLGAGAWVATADLAAHHLDYTLSNLIACAIAADILQARAVGWCGLSDACASTSV